MRTPLVTCLKGGMLAACCLQCALHPLQIAISRTGTHLQFWRRLVNSVQNSVDAHPAQTVKHPQRDSYLVLLVLIAAATARAQR